MTCFCICELVVLAWGKECHRVNSRFVIEDIYIQKYFFHEETVFPRLLQSGGQTE